MGPIFPYVKTFCSKRRRKGEKGEGAHANKTRSDKKPCLVENTFQLDSQLSNFSRSFSGLVLFDSRIPGWAIQKSGQSTDDKIIIELSVARSTF